MTSRVWGHQWSQQSPWRALQPSQRTPQGGAWYWIAPLASREAQASYSTGALMCVELHGGQGWLHAQHDAGVRTRTAAHVLKHNTVANNLSTLCSPYAHAIVPQRGWLGGWKTLSARRAPQAEHVPGSRWTSHQGHFCLIRYYNIICIQRLTVVKGCERVDMLFTEQHKHKLNFDKHTLSISASASIRPKYLKMCARGMQRPRFGRLAESSCWLAKFVMEARRWDIALSKQLQADEILLNGDGIVGRVGLRVGGPNSCASHMIEVRRKIALLFPKNAARCHELRGPRTLAMFNHKFVQRDSRQP